MQGREASKAANETPNGNQDEWSYTVYDIDGGSKVTDQVVFAYLLKKLAFCDVHSILAFYLLFILIHPQYPFSYTGN